MAERFKPFMKEARGSEFDKWAPKVVTDPSSVGVTHSVSEDEINQIKQEAFDQAYREGRLNAEHDVVKLQTQLSTLIEKLIQPSQILDRDIDQELVDIIVLMTKTCLQAELSLNPDKIVVILDEIKQYLPLSSTTRKLYLSPQDMGVITQRLKDIDIDEGDVIEDPSLSPGEYRYITDKAELDGRVQTRMENILDMLQDGGDKTDD